MICIFVWFISIETQTFQHRGATGCNSKLETACEAVEPRQASDEPHPFLRVPVICRISLEVATIGASIKETR
jgi:hypothetical protein